MKRPTLQLRPGVTLIELIVVLAITALMVPAAFSILGNNDRSKFDIATGQVQSDMRLALNRVQSGIGPEPDPLNCPGSGCSIQPGELLFGEALIFGSSGNFDGNSFPSVGSVGTQYLSYRLKIGTSESGQDNQIYNYLPVTKKDFSQDLGYKCYKENDINAPSCSNGQIGVVFYKLNKTANTLPAQTQFFKQSDLRSFGPPCGGSNKINCYGSGYTSTPISKLIIMLQSRTDANIKSCIIINRAANDVQKYTGRDKCGL